MMKNRKLFFGVLAVVGIAIVGISLFVSSTILQTKKPTEIIISDAREDEHEPGPVEEECEMHLESYMNSFEFVNKGFSECKLIESKVGWGEERCPAGFSPQGCSICKLECK